MADNSGDPTSWPEVKAWRKAKRPELIAARVAARDQRKGWDAAITVALWPLLGAVDGRTIAVYWPFRGEYEPRPLLRELAAAGATLALPVVVEKNAPLQFRPWAPGEPLVPGIWQIPVPATDAVVVPDLVVAPLVGWDEAGYRLGYGGGYYDRTLAALTPRPMAIGVGYGLGRLATIHPQPHDIPMDVIVTERSIRWRADSRFRDAVEDTGSFASPACLLHELDPAYRS